RLEGAVGLVLIVAVAPHDHRRPGIFLPEPALRRLCRPFADERRRRFGDRARRNGSAEERNSNGNARRKTSHDGPPCNFFATMKQYRAPVRHGRDDGRVGRAVSATGSTAETPAPAGSSAASGSAAAGRWWWASAFHQPIRD